MTILWLSLRDYAHEWRMSVCLVLALAAVLTPLLVLFGLKFGVVDTLRARLVGEPRTREIHNLASGQFDAAWFVELARVPEVGFLLPRTRAIASTMTLVPEGARGRGMVVAELIPSAPGDPLLLAGAAPQGVHEAVLSASAARQLGVGPGTLLRGNISRIVDGRRENAAVPLSVTGVLREAAHPRPAALVSLKLLEATEDYRDGHAVPGLGWRGAPAADAAARRYAGFRLYARSIDDVPALRDRLEAMGLQVRTAAAEIERVQMLDRNLSTVFWLVAAIGLGGFLLSLGVNLWANVERKRRELGILRLVGVSGAAIVAFPVLQAGFTALAGGAVAGLAYLPMERIINARFAASLEEGELVCRLLAGHFAVGLLATLACAVVASALAGWRASRIEPAEGARDG